MSVEIAAQHAALAIAAAGGLAYFARRLRRRFRTFSARRRMAYALRGERRAARVLRRLGYRIEAAQPRRDWSIRCGDRARAISLCADFLVSRRGRRYVAEVKTGARAPSVDTAATRRQLLEYSVAYDASGVLLVDAERGDVTEVSFPGHARSAPGAGGRLLAFALGGAAGAALVTAYLSL